MLRKGLIVDISIRVYETPFNEKSRNVRWAYKPSRAPEIVHAEAAWNNFRPGWWLFGFNWTKRVFSRLKSWADRIV